MNHIRGGVAVSDHNAAIPVKSLVILLIGRIAVSCIEGRRDIRTDAVRVISKSTGQVQPHHGGGRLIVTGIGNLHDPLPFPFQAVVELFCLCLLTAAVNTLDDNQLSFIFH